MHSDFAMLDQAILAAMHKFNRVFDRDNVVMPLHVGVIHHRRQGGGLSGAGRSGDQNEALLEHGKFLQDGRQIQIVARQYRRRNQTENRGDTVFLLEEICAITGHARHFIAKIDVGGFLEDFDFSFGCDLINHRFQVVVSQRRVIHADEVAIDAQQRRVVGGEMKVGGLLLSH